MRAVRAVAEPGDRLHPRAEARDGPLYFPSTSPVVGETFAPLERI